MDPAPRLRRLAAIGTAVLAVLIVALYFVEAPSADAVFIGLTLAAAAALAPLAVRGLRPGDAWPYALYAAVLVIVWVVSPAPEAGAELGRQGVWLAAVLAAAAAARGGGGPMLLAVHLTCLVLVLLQIPGPRSGFDHLGRPGFYHALEQWSGYPEIGLLMAMGAAAMCAVALGARGSAVRAAAALLGAAMAAATLALQSRSAVLTVGVTALWLTAVSVVKWRNRLALLLAAGAAAGLLWVSIRGPGLAGTVERAADAVARETAIRQAGWTAALAMLKTHPVTGVGLGRYPAEYEARGLGTDSTHAYNIVLHVAAETGVIGLAVWLLVWTRVVWLGLRAAGRTPAGVTAFAVHAMLVAFLVRSQSEHFLANLDTSLRLLVIVGLLVGLAEGVGKGRSAE